MCVVYVHARARARVCVCKLILFNFAAVSTFLILSIASLLMQSAMSSLVCNFDFCSNLQEFSAFLQQIRHLTADAINYFFHRIYMYFCFCDTFCFSSIVGTQTPVIVDL